MVNFVVYLRVGKAPSLSQQEVTVRQFVQANHGRIVASFTEDFTKRGVSTPSTWPALQEAIDVARSKGATLVIAYVDRLSRSAPFTCLLLGSGVSFVCCDLPDCNHLTIHIIAATAEEESHRIRTRTREGLAAAKAAGVKLGSNRKNHWKGREHKRGWRQAVARSCELRSDRAARAYQAILPEIKVRRERGESLPKIVEWLNGSGHLTTAGKPFTQTAVWRIIDRYLGKEYLGSVRRKRGDSAAGNKVGIACTAVVRDNR
jgi:DNA invertase Pin-like site-specific DNA recombinase